MPHIPLAHSTASVHSFILQWISGLLPTAFAYITSVVDDGKEIEKAFRIHSQAAQH